MEVNYSDELANVKQCLGSKEFWRLSLLGKMIVLKSKQLQDWFTSFHRCQQIRDCALIIKGRAEKPMRGSM